MFLGECGRSKAFGQAGFGDAVRWIKYLINNYEYVLGRTLCVIDASDASAYPPLSFPSSSASSATFTCIYSSEDGFHEQGPGAYVDMNTSRILFLSRVACLRNEISQSLRDLGLQTDYALANEFLPRDELPSFSVGYNSPLLSDCDAGVTFGPGALITLGSRLQVVAWTSTLPQLVADPSRGSMGRMSRFIANPPVKYRRAWVKYQMWNGLITPRKKGLHAAMHGSGVYNLFPVWERQGIPRLGCGAKTRLGLNCLRIELQEWKSNKRLKGGLTATFTNCEEIKSLGRFPLAWLSIIHLCAGAPTCPACPGGNWILPALPLNCHFHSCRLSAHRYAHHSKGLAYPLIIPAGTSESLTLLGWDSAVFHSLPPPLASSRWMHSASSVPARRVLCKIVREPVARPTASRGEWLQYRSRALDGHRFGGGGFACAAPMNSALGIGGVGAMLYIQSMNSGNLGRSPSCSYFRMQLTRTGDACSHCCNLITGVTEGVMGEIAAAGFGRLATGIVGVVG
ncbi:hypothetical protein B0H16DRAFT_1690689 [Mycena metata]|uniref:Uncharacterized protein n=1 Tax=Mycena metata TaxID=1033252 RepID=A0AAD7NBF6_9AGAR|nr:hypothetical protein B0H16DRAFT_1690689 [Mycena metata]